MICDRRIHKTIWLAFLLILSICMLVVFNSIGRVTLSPDSTVESLTFSSEDSSILAVWKQVNATNLQAIQVDVTDDENNTILSEQCSPYTTTFRFAQGEHGKAYTLRISMVLTDGTKTAEVWGRRIFLRYSNLPDLPFLDIRTVNGIQPTYETVLPPEGCWGLGIVNNEYVSAGMTVTEDGKAGFSNTVRIRIRGNTSADRERKPYKLKLDTAADLLGDGVYAHTDWLLLPANDLKQIVGTETALLCGMQWQPRYRPVNVMLNGDYLGLYWLTESVSTGDSRCKIDDSGYLIELDAYWWNSEGYYFKIDGQERPMGYTFTYPEDDRLSEQRIGAIRDYVNEAMRLLKSGDPRYASYIDVQSWADWLLTHDILGTWDSGGSNLYYHKHAHDVSNPTAAKLKMGPAWDFGTIYQQTDSWARVRYSASAGFSQLLSQPDFLKAYLDRWESISKTLTHSVLEKLTALVNENGSALEESLLLDSVRWQTEQRDLHGEIAFVREWFVSRTAWINKQMYG